MTRAGVILAAAVALVFVGCDGASNPSPRKAVAPKKAAAAAEAAVEEAKTAEANFIYSYNPLGKRDPFRSPLLDQVRNNPQGNASCNEPLCMWDLDQLVLVAVVTGDANPIAMLEDPQGRGYVVRRNSRVGKQGGKITQILRDSITVTEYWSDPTGKVIPKPTQKMIQEERNVVPALDLVSGKTFE